jgi:inorganic phosphate transporter, PiT family
MIWILIAGALFLAFSNGANDNFKGVATLFGSGTTNYIKAINWATLTTLMGSVAAIFLAGTLVKNFSGKGLVPDILIQSPEFAVSIAIGAALTVFLATKIGMPISTTHSLVGALVGSGLVAVGMSFNFDKLISAFLFPLIASPLLAAGTSLIVYLFFRKARQVLKVEKESCVCIQERVETRSDKQSVALAAMVKTGELEITTGVACAENYTGKLFGLNAQNVLDSAHFLSAGVVSFARGLNDTPKIMGLLLVVQFLDVRLGLLILAIAIALGGLLNARMVGETVSKKITPMNHGQGFTANLITGLLVTTASLHGMPVSTTHVSVGSIFGIGTVTRRANVKVVRNILFSWVLTLPIAAAISALIYWGLTTLL